MMPILNALMRDILRQAVRLGSSEMDFGLWVPRIKLLVPVSHSVIFALCYGYR